MNAKGASAAQPTPAALQDLLHADHERLHELFKKLVAAFSAGARDDAAQLWDEFDAGLENHLTLEEELIFPPFAERHPNAAAALVSEHAALRNQLTELGVGVDLHLTRATAVIRFINELEAHARREDVLLYGWAQEHLPEAIQVTVRARLHASFGPARRRTLNLPR